MAENNDSTSGFTWFLAGAVCGAVVALLYAPHSGEKTRKYIVKKTNETRDALADSSKEIVDRGKDLFDQARQSAQEAANLFERATKLSRG